MYVLLQKIGVVRKKEWAQENTKLCLEIHKVHAALYHTIPLCTFQHMTQNH